MKILDLDHVQITVPRGAEQQAREFYCGLLGLAEINKPRSLRARDGFWVMAGERAMHVGTEDGIDRTQTKAHVAYAVDDVQGWKQKLQGLGIQPLESVPIEGVDRFEFRDPFGNRVEFLRRL